MANIDQLEKVYRKQTDFILDMAKPLLFLLNKKRKRSNNDSKALRSLLMLWVHLFREITHSRRLNILTQTHPNHIGLLSRAAGKLPVGGEDLFGTDFVNELVSQVKTASLIISSVAGPSTSATPGKLSRSHPLYGSPNDNNSFARYANSFLIFFPQLLADCQSLRSFCYHIGPSDNDLWVVPLDFLFVYYYKKAEFFELKLITKQQRRIFPSPLST
jgi:hypothetical protein